MATKTKNAAKKTTSIEKFISANMATGHKAPTAKKLGAVIGQSNLIQWAKIKSYYDLYDLLDITVNKADRDDGDSTCDFRALIHYLPSLDTFVKTGEFKGIPVLFDGSYLVFVHAKLPVFVDIQTNRISSHFEVASDGSSNYDMAWDDDINVYGNSSTMDGNAEDFAPCGLLAPYGKAYCVFINADQDTEDTNVMYGENPLLDSKLGPTISFNCAGRFFDDFNFSDQFIENINANGLVLLDYTEDERKAATSTQISYFNSVRSEPKATTATISRKMSAKFPSISGFSFVYNCEPIELHRCGYALFELTDGNRIIFGQDEGTYFGSEFPGESDNVVDAIQELKPESIRDLKDLVRQGEWFLVPVTEDEVPNDPQTIAMDLSDADSPVLPKDSPDSADHTIQAMKVIVGRDGWVYAKDATLNHEHPDTGVSDHAPVTVQGWVKFARNTATRSFSVKGVD